MSQYCQPSDVQALFPSTYAADTTQLLAAITKASAWVENTTRRVLSVQTYTEEAELVVDRKGRIVGRVTEYPITGVSALSIRLDSWQDFVPLDTSWVDFAMKPERLFWYRGSLGGTSPSLSGRYGTGLPRNAAGVIQFTYTAGYDPIPADIALATALYAQSLVMLDANPLGASTIATPDGGSVTLPPVDLIVQRAKALLNNYVRYE